MSGDGAVVDSEMSTSINSEASLDIDIVRHHDGQLVTLQLQLSVYHYSSGHVYRQPSGGQGPGPVRHRGGGDGGDGAPVWKT